MMADRNESQQQPPRTKAEMVERIVGLSRQHDAEDIEFWRNATDEVRGRILCGLLETVNAIGHYPEKKVMFPGFPKNNRSEAQK